MRILVLHAWLKGNLGDVLQLSVLLSALRELRPRVLDLAGFPARPADETAEVLGLTDHYVPDTFPWYWKPGADVRREGGVRAVVETAAQGAVLTLRCTSSVRPGPTWRTTMPARRAPCVTSPSQPSSACPSCYRATPIGPLRRDGLAAVAKATVRIAREPATYKYLRERGLPAVLSADLAFLYPYAGSAERAAPFRPPYRLIFLRSNNLDANRLRLEGGALFEGTRTDCRGLARPAGTGHERLPA